MRHIGYYSDEHGNTYADFRLENFYDDVLLAHKLSVSRFGVVRAKMTDEEFAAVRECAVQRREAAEIMRKADADESAITDTIARDTERLEGGE